MIRHPLFWLLLVVLFAIGVSGFQGFNFTPIAIAEKAVR